MGVPDCACHYWSMYDLEPEAALERAAALGYRGMDLATGDLGRGARLDAATLGASTRLQGRLRRAAEAEGIRFTDLFVVPPHDLGAAAAGARRENRAVVAAAVRAARRIGVPGVTLSPGRDSFERACVELRALVDVAGSDRLRLSVEPHLESVAETPERARELVETVPGLALTLDYSHFIAGGHPQASVEPLHRHAAHVHLRQARPGRLAAPAEDGTVDFARVLALLHDAGYAGALTVEYVPAEWRDQHLVDSERENERLRAHVERLIGEIWGSDR
jgi:sugar phosphate isomerase/epimerase